MEDPRDDEYSVVSQPERYDALLVRARVWAEVLVDVAGATASVEAPPPSASAGPPVDRAVLVRPPPAVSDAPALWLLESHRQGDAPEAKVASVSVAVGDDGIVLGAQPDCGCDACDAGSESLLDALDELVLSAIGPFVHLRGEGWYVFSNVAGRRSGAGGPGLDRDLTAMQQLADALAAGEDVRLPDDAQALVSRGWGVG